MADTFHDHQSGAEDSFMTQNWRYLIAAVVVAALVLSACLVLVNPGEAVVITRFGNPVRVVTTPGLAFKLPPPMENAVVVDLRLRTTSSGLHDVGTRDGLRILVQAYIAWQVPDDAGHILQFLRAVRNQPGIAAEQLRSFTGSALEIAASSFDLANLVNTNARQIRLDEFENALHRRIDDQALRVYGITVRQVGLERLTLPAQTLGATIERMKAERDTVAAERSAEGERAAAQIQSDANRDSRVLIAKANADAADIEAKSRIEAAGIYKKAYAGDPQLYTLLRSLDLARPGDRSQHTAHPAHRLGAVSRPGGRPQCQGRQMSDDLKEEMKDVGPLGQAVALAFRFLFIAACVIALGWFVSNFRQVPPDSQAVVMRFGAVARMQGSGLLMALPRPLEQIVVLPRPGAADRAAHRQFRRRRRRRCRQRGLRSKPRSAPEWRLPADRRFQCGASGSATLLSGERSGRLHDRPGPCASGAGAAVHRQRDQGGGPARSGFHPGGAPRSGGPAFRSRGARAAARRSGQ